MANSHAGRFWSVTKRLTGGLLTVWLLLNLLGVWFARDLSDWMDRRFPIDFWIAAQAAVPIYLLIIVVYVVSMDRLEARYLDDASTENPGPVGEAARKVAE